MYRWLDQSVCKTAALVGQSWVAGAGMCEQTVAEPVKGKMKCEYWLLWSNPIQSFKEMNSHSDRNVSEYTVCYSCRAVQATKGKKGRWSKSEILEYLMSQHWFVILGLVVLKAKNTYNVLHIVRQRYIRLYRFRVHKLGLFVMTLSTQQVAREKHITLLCTPHKYAQFKFSSYRQTWNLKYRKLANETLIHMYKFFLCIRITIGKVFYCNKRTSGSWKVCCVEARAEHSCACKRQ